MSGDIAVTIFADKFAASKTEQFLCVAELAHLIEITSASAKGRLPLLKLARFGDIPTDKHCLRWDGNILAVSGVEGDYDAGLIVFGRAVEILGAVGVQCVAYTSPSHCENIPKWRILCPFSQEYPPDQRDRFMGRLNGLFGGAFAGESWTKSQSYYYGSVNRNPSHSVVLLDGTPIDWMVELDAIAIGKPVKSEGTDGENNGATRPVYPAADPSKITNKRLAGKLNSLLANISNAPQGSVHYTLLRIARVVGGYAHLLGYTEEELLGLLLNALPPDDNPDPKTERQTALDGLKHGMRSPLTLEERPFGGWRASA